MVLKHGRSLLITAGAAILLVLLLPLNSYAAKEIIVRVASLEAALSREPAEDGEVIRMAQQGEEFHAVTTVNNYYLLKDEVTESFLYAPFWAMEELGELDPNVLISGRMPPSPHDNLSYWQVIPQKEVEAMQLRSGASGGMLTAHNGKKYPAQYDYHYDYQPVIDGRRLARDAMAYLGAPYVSGGTTTAGIDCSGLTLTCLAKQGIDVVHRASLQALEGRYISHQDLRLGDLVFFRDETTPRYLSHVGIYMGRGKFIHASQSFGGVVITSLSHEYFKAHYAFARRL